MSIKDANLSEELNDSSENKRVLHEGRNKLFEIFKTNALNSITKSFAKEQFGESVEKVHSTIRLGRLSLFFAVDDKYILQKLMRILFPFRHKGWERKVTVNEVGESEFLTPSSDINSPDLYIPLMSFITCVLILSVSKAISFSSQSFTPEVLMKTSSSCLALFAGELLITKVALQLVRVEIPLLEAGVLLGYKFVPIAVNLSASIALGRWGYYCSWILSSVALGVFLRKTVLGLKMAGIEVPESLSVFSIVLALTQPFLCFFVGFL